jgi:hypothetical protein
VKGSLGITLGPSESVLIVFETASASESNAGDTITTLGGPTRTLETSPVHWLTGPWEIHLDPVDGAAESRRVKDLGNTELREYLRSFAGTIVYKTTVTIPERHGKVWLSLGRLHDISKLMLNGRDMGVRWFGEHVYDLDVITTLGNYLKTLKSNATARVWTERTPVYPSGLVNPVGLHILR